MFKNKRQFLTGENGDDSLQTLGASDYLRLMNGRIGVTEYGRDNRIENVPGTVMINQAVYPPYGTNLCIGSVPDNVRNRLIYFIYNTFGDHGIYAYDLESGITYAVLYDSQVIGGLNFDKNFRIDRNANVIGDLLYFTDNTNEPRRLNIEAGIKMNQASYVTDVLPYSYPMNPEVITIIRRPPFYTLTIDKKNDATFTNNFVKDASLQFAVRYFYRDYEYSVLGAFSELAPYNSPQDNFNYVQITLPQTEVIDQDVLEVELVFRLGNSGACQIIKTWDKDDINAHNTGTTLTFNFYNNIAGLSLSLHESVKPFDSVPLLSRTIEFSRNRNFLGNNVEGYDTPSSSSMTAEVVKFENGQTNLKGYWAIVRLNYYIGGSVVAVRDYYALVLGGGLSPDHYFFSLYNEPPIIPPSTIDVTTATYSSTGVTLLMAQIAQNSGITYDYYIVVSNLDSGYRSDVTGATISLGGAMAFKSNGTYRYGTVFFDKYRRKCGVSLNDNNLITTPDRSYDQTVYNLGIDWGLSNVNAVNEIPNWAYYYAPVRTHNLTTRFFAQARANSIFYTTRLNDGTYTHTTTAYASGLYGVSIDISQFIGFGFGYTFEEGSGDLVNLYFQTGVTGKKTLPILAQDGKWLILKLDNFGALGGTITPLFEIFTPYKELTNEPYYEVGQIYPITNPTASNRTYNTTKGTFNGDIYVLQRTNTNGNYFTENMSPNDLFWRNWYSDIGWSTTIDEIGQQTKTSSISWSNTIIEGTRTNGLSTFDALDERNLPSECGAIQKLQIASKLAEQGKIMLAICVNETVSMYLSEVQLVGASANAFIAESTGVIGTINVLQGSFGTVNPESVVQYLGNVYWIDVNSGVMVQYSSNGLYPISQFKQARFFQRYCKNYLEASTGNLDNINGFHHLPSFIDPLHKEVGISLVGLIYQNYATTLPSYSSVPSYATSIINRFDIYDQLAKTMVFQYEKNQWNQDFEYLGEQYDYIENQMFGFKNGVLYKFNADTTNWNKWFGTQYPVRLCFAQNTPIPSGVKEIFDIALEGSQIPDFTVLYTDYPNVQITDLASNDYSNKEGVLYARFLRDRLSPNATGTADEKLYKGDVIISQVPQVMLEWQAYRGLIYINFVDVGMMISRGQKSILQ